MCLLPAHPGTYRSAGVDIDAAESAKDQIAQRISATHNVSVLRGVGLFGGFFRSPISTGEVVLVSSADSVGTKVLVAAMAGRHTGIGIDLVNHCVNDILACGARPLFFLDYYATPSLDHEHLRQAVAGMTEACLEAGCALIGGETAQLPGIYQPGSYDLAGFIVGAVEEHHIVDGAAIREDDVIVGLASDGLHTNGFTLARAALGLDGDSNQARNVLDQRPFDSTETLGELLLTPHRSYLPDVTALLARESVTGMAHITGGGITGNVGRIIPDGLVAEIDTAAWSPNLVFDLIQERGSISTSEMYRVFNMGIGFVAIVRPEALDESLAVMRDACVIGRIATTNDRTRVRLSGLKDG
jgi:phosphoribosylformylglycinamidine cyclo-ligase